MSKDHSKHKKAAGELARCADPALFKALGDPNRLRLLATLAACARPCRVTELSKCCDVDFSVVSRHLSLLRGAGVLESHRHGKEIHYSVRVQHLVRVLRQLADALDECCGGGRESAPCCESAPRGRSRCR